MDRGDDRNLIFSAFFEGQFRLYRMPLKEPESDDLDCRSAVRRTSVDVEPFEPPLKLTR